MNSNPDLQEFGVDALGLILADDSADFVCLANSQASCYISTPPVAS